MPDWRPQLRMRLDPLDLDPTREAEIIEELSEHLDERYRELTGSGVDHAPAMDQIGRELLAPDAFAAHMRSLRQANVPERISPGAPQRSLLEDLRQDLRLSIRMLRKQVALTAAVVATLALGIGANGAIFTLVDRVLLRELPFPDAQRLVSIWESTDTVPADHVSPSNLVDWQERSESFEAIGGYVPNIGAMVMAGPGGAEHVPRQWVSAGVFQALGIDPIVGQTFMPDDDRPGSNGVMLAEQFWRTRFGSDPSVVGESMRLDGRPFTIVGVVPREAQILGRTSVWAIAPIRDLPPAARGSHVLATVARLKPGVSIDAATEELARIAASLAREYPTTNEGRGIAIEPLRDNVLGIDLRRTSLLFVGVAGVVLLICFANIASLLLTRTAARRDELVVRSMLGADRQRLLRQLRTENLVLSLLGGTAGVLVALALLRAAPSLMPSGLLPSGMTLAFDSRALLFCGAAALIIGLLFSTASASQIVQLVSPSGRSFGTRTVTSRTSKTREWLVVAQVATAVALLYSAGLLSRTLFELESNDPGYRAESVLTLLVDPLGSQYPSPEQLLAFYAAVETEIESLSGVSEAAWTSALPLGESMMGRAYFEITGQTTFASTQRPAADLQVISPDYFRALDQPLLAGRPFNAGDTAEAVPVCIVNEAFVRAHLSGGTAIGRRVSRWSSEEGEGDADVCEIVGVAANTRMEADETERRTQIYLPLGQLTPDDIFLVVRPITGNAEALGTEVRAAIGRVDSAQLVGVRHVATLKSISRDATAAYRFRAALVVTFAGLALVLAMVGLFGVLAYAVQGRWREYGVRMALGARAGNVIDHIVKGALRLVAPGVFVGVLLAIGIGQLLGAMLFAVRPFDPSTFAIVIAVLAVTAAAAMIGPALRASRIDPVVALRSE